jgi:hypothetical protein
MNVQMTIIKTSNMAKKKWTEPDLFVDDHHGIYMGQIAWQQLAERYKDQARKQLSAEDIKSIEAGPDDEWHFEAMTNLENMTFVTETGQKWELSYREGGIWAVPACYRGKKREDFFSV